MASGGTSSDAVDGAFGIGIPIRCSHARQGWNEIDATIIWNGSCQCLDVAGGLDDAQPIPEPLDDTTAHKDAALEGVVDRIAYLPGNGRQQTVLGEDGMLPCVHQKEATSSISVLYRPWSPKRAAC